MQKTTFFLTSSISQRQQETLLSHVYFHILNFYLVLSRI